MYYSKQILLKDNTLCLLKNGESADGAEALRCFNQTHMETDNLLTYADENSLTAEDESIFLDTQTKSDDSVEICAFIGDSIVGMAGFEPVGRKDKLKHRASFGVCIEKAYWRKGIGAALTEACILCAKKAGYRQLELDVVDTNEGAISLYKRFGFVEYGRNPKAFLKRDGTWQGNILMYLDLGK